MNHKTIGFIGTAPQANDGSLLIFAGGDNQTIDSVQTIFDVLGRRRVSWVFRCLLSV